MSKRSSHRVLSLLLAVVMLFGMLPTAALAAEEPTYTKLTAADELVDGQYVMVVENGKTLGVFDDTGWVLPGAADVDLAAGPVSGAPEWTIAVNADGSVTLTDGNGVSVKPKTGNNNGILAGTYDWAVSFADGVFQFKGQGADSTTLAFNDTSNWQKFRSYKNGTVAGSPSTYLANFTLYAVSGGAVTPDPDPDPEPEKTVVDISAALAGDDGAEFTVKGVVTLVDGRNIYLQDATGGMCAYMSSAPADELFGKTIIATGTRGSYNGLQQLGSASYELSSGLTLSAKTATIGSLTSADVCSYVKLTGLEVVSVSGTTVNLKDADGEEIQIYKAVLGETTLEAGDKIDFTGAVGIYNETLQLRNTVATEITKLTDDPYASIEKNYSVFEKVASPADGDVVAIYNAGNAMAMTSTMAGYNLAGQTAAVDANGYLLVDMNETATIDPMLWTVGLEENVYTFKQGETISLAGVISGNYVNFALDDATAAAEWTLLPVADGGDTYYIQSTTLENSYGKAYLEYYNGFKFHTTAEDKLTESTYGMDFYKLVRAGEKTETDPEPPVTSAPFADGDKVVIYAPAYNMALSSQKTGYYNVGVEVTASEGVLSGYGETEVWTVVDNKDGTFSFAQNGQKIGLANSNSSMDLGAVNDRWALTDLGSGLYNVKNTVRGNFMEWYSKYNNWSTYGSSFAATDDQFQLAFYPVPQYAKLTDTIAEGDEFLVYYNKGSLVMSDVASGNKLTGIAATPEGDFIPVADGMAVLTAVKDGENWAFTTEDGKYLTCGATGNSLTLEDTASDYSLWTLKAVTGGIHIVSVNAKFSGQAQALDVHNNLFTTFGEKDNDDYLFNLYKLTDEMPVAGADGLPAEGDLLVLYNESAKGVLAAQEAGSTVVNGVPAQIVEEKAIPENGARIFKVEKNGSYYRFYNETDGYLCSNGTGNNAFYAKDASEDADWTITELEDGWKLESRTAKFNGQHSQYLEYYAEAYKTYSMYNVTDYSIYTFHFYPVADGVKSTGGIVDDPKVVFGTLLDAFIGQDYTFTFTLDTVKGVTEMPTAKVEENDIALTLADGVYTGTIPADLLAGKEKVTIQVSAVDNGNVAFTGSADVNVLDEITFTDLTPAAGSETGDDKRPAISATMANAGEAPTVVMTINDAEVTPTVENGVISYLPEADLADGRTTVTLTVTRADGKVGTQSWSFTVGEAQYQHYFGQLHSHTEYSDGSGTLSSALNYISSLPESANVDFVAFTDHSNFFDSKSDANPEGALYDMSLASAANRAIWNEYKDTISAFNAAQNDVIAIAGFEMTWSGGPGHINTFNTPGVVSRNNTTLNDKSNDTGDAGMKAYYNLLSQPEGADAISQLNHPGKTFGNFTDFAYWDAAIDSRVQLVEVGNGEGQIGAGGYYPSYEQYILALDKGWHVAPSNNQDNHKGHWGNANEARDVIITDDFTEEGIYEAIRARRMYATEDKNLELTYTLNGNMLGSTISETSDKLNIEVSFYDPDKSDSISKVEVVVNSGKVAHTWSSASELASGNLSVSLDPTFSYYFIRVTQGDGDLAVTAPVWVGEILKLGINAFECGTATPVTDEEVTLTTTLFNSESVPATLKSLTYTTNGSVVLGTDTTEQTIPANGTLDVDFNWTPEAAKLTTITVTAVLEQKGQEYTFSKSVELDVMDASKMVYIGIDASHLNEYVAGNYSASMGNFSKLAAEYGVRTVELKTSEELIAACGNEKFKALIFTVPSRRNDDKMRKVYYNYTDDEINAITSFNNGGGAVIVAGWSDHYENYSNYDDNTPVTSYPAEDHMAAQQNKILAALGSSLRISDDATYDDSLNGGQAYRLYFSTYGESFLNEGVEVDADKPNDRLYSEVFSHYGGTTIYAESSARAATLPATVTPVVFGHSTTYSVDTDKDGLGGSSVPKYATPDGDDRLLVMATEELSGKGLIVVSGAAFMSNFEVQATVEDNNAEKNYSNYKICENLLTRINPVVITPIADVQAEEQEGVKFTIEGIVTSNAFGYDQDTAFFDCIYLQDETGGINAFPVAGEFKIGDKVRIVGSTSSYQGERQISVISVKKVGEGSVTPKEVTAQQINSKAVMGQLVTLKGVVTAFGKENDLVQTIIVRDKDGNEARVFIDGYITTAEDVKNLALGCEITVTGCASYDVTFENPNFPKAPYARIRIRDRADVVCGEVVEHICDFTWTVTQEGDCTTDKIETGVCDCGVTDTRITPAPGHSYGDWVTILEPTATEAGLQERVCAECGDVDTESIPALGGSEDGEGDGEDNDNVDTGDHSNLYLWSALLVLSGAAFTLLAVTGRKKRARR